MCGIHAIICKQSIDYMKEHGPEKTTHENLKKRGPDDTNSVLITLKNDWVARLDFYRLAIIGTKSGMQPFANKNTYLMCNGEIYNYLELAKDIDVPEHLIRSDCELIQLLYLHYKKDIVKVLHAINGVYAFVLIDYDENIVYWGRDTWGVRPLYYSASSEGVALSSHLSDGLFPVVPKFIYTFCLKTKMLCVKHIPDKLYLFTVTEKKELIYRTAHPLPADDPFLAAMTEDVFVKKIDYACKTSVVAELAAERPIGFLVSGGVDSSLVFALACQAMEKNMPAANKLTVQAFTLVFKEDILTSKDLIQAKKVVDYVRKSCKVNILHHIVSPSYDDIKKHIPDVIQQLDTYDTTTIRASIPMYVLCQWIVEHTDVRVLMSGEGADELFGGYIDFLSAKTVDAYVARSEELMHELYLFDCLRADRAVSYNGIELRVPLLNEYLTTIVRWYARFNAAFTLEKRIEKYLFRKMASKYLPTDVAMGCKEAFSNSSPGWIPFVQAFAAEKYIEGKMDYSKLMGAAASLQHATLTVEQKYYLTLFIERHSYAATQVLPKYWVPKFTSTNESSATILSEYLRRSKETIF